MPKHNHILVVDHSRTARKLLTNRIQQELPHSRVIACGSAAEAVRLMLVNQFDCVTTALQLPDESGVELVHRLRKIPNYLTTPVILISGDTENHLRHKGYDDEVTYYVDKAEGIERYIDVLRGYLPSSRTTLEGHRVLYVEDNPPSPGDIRKKLESLGLAVSHTDDGQYALELIRQRLGRKGEGYDLVITDLSLAGELSGLELVTEIRETLHLSIQRLPVIVISADPRESLRVSDAFSAGANYFLNRPVSEEALQQRLHGIFWG